VLCIRTGCKLTVYATIRTAIVPVLCWGAMYVSPGLWQPSYCCNAQLVMACVSWAIDSTCNSRRTMQQPVLTFNKMCSSPATCTSVPAYLEYTTRSPDCTASRSTHSRHCRPCQHTTAVSPHKCMMLQQSQTGPPRVTLFNGQVVRRSCRYG
jgi:hypothetical protein